MDPQCPHVMFTIGHAIKPGDELLRGEALAIVSAVVTRSEHFSSEEHRYIPVSIPRRSESKTLLTEPIGSCLFHDG